MATVTSVTLQKPKIDGDTATVTVDYAVEFDSTEAGKPHRVTIELWAKELDGEGGDDLLAALYRRPLHTFRFGGFFFARQTAKTVTPHNAGVFTDSVSNTVTRAALDEDPATYVYKPGVGKLPIPHEDEVYARVIVRREASADSDYVGFSA